MHTIRCGNTHRQKCCAKGIGKEWCRATHGTIRTVNTTYAAALMTTTHPQNWCRKPYAATQHLMLLTMGVCTRNMSSLQYINKITQMHQVGISVYFMRKMHGQTTLKSV